jgi:hypothetical protein
VIGFIFLTGTIRQNQSTFPGSFQYKNASNQTVASLSDNGDLYLKSNLLTSNACTAPPYEPALWNNVYLIMASNDCYNYGNNQITYTLAQPGRAAGYREWDDFASDMNVAYVTERALADGLTWVGLDYPGAGYTCPGGGHLVYMAVAPGLDYHWWRKDSGTSYWSHKPGQLEATNLDADGDLITNPLESNKDFTSAGGNNYSANGGFYCTCGNNANVR